MKKRLPTRLLSLLLVVALLAGIAVPVNATGAKSNVTFTQVDNSAVTAELLTKDGDEQNTMDEYADTDIVRVSIFLKDQPTIMAGFSLDSIAANSQAMAYRADLKEKQAQVTAAIEKTLGEKLDVAWNLTLAANVISANVKYGQIEAIEQMAGVSEVLIETCYAPAVVDREEENDPMMSTSSAQIGSSAAWAAGYTGAGTRIAVIDTGADTDHQSLNPDAFQYSLAYQAGKSGMSVEEYIESLDLLDADEIAAVSSELNAEVGAEAYINSKIPFGYNYVDGDLDVTHDNDDQGSHGSHVSGIATANAYIPTKDGFANALETVLIQGVAPDAQLVTMKVFGKTGGAYDSDYLAALEDAIVLGCDAANLSLGTSSPGNSRNATAAYQAIMDNLTKAGMVVAIASGNEGAWVENAENIGYLYAEDVSMDAVGAPGSFTNSLAVASVDNDGTTGYYITVGGSMIVYNESSDFSNGPFAAIAGEREYVLIEGVGTAEDWAAVGEALTGKIAICSRGETSFYEKAQLAVEAGAIATIIYNNQPGIINMDLSDYPYEQPAVSITQADGQVIKAASTPVTDDAGNILYYTGTMTVSDTLGNGQFHSAYYTMSSFSSWGVPGSLEMKPEITAPGGSIYSINGVDTSGTAYEVNSGTSMASPQVAGMAALVAQYIHENDLVAKTGLSERQLSQSLLMSTAVPMEASENTYYSVLQQGAGLANVGAAICADSYITMAEGSSAGAADGKVKVELGDDPNKTGSYSAAFTIHNLTDVEKAFDLSADFFIQAPVSDGTYMYMDTSTVLIGADVTWTVDGVEIAPAAQLNGMDFNGDGIVNSDDGQAILDYATGVAESLTNLDKADLDADGDVDSYDAYLFLNTLGSGAATVPAGGSVTVTVDFSLSDSWKETLDYYYPNGTYIQGYLYAASMADAEGVAGTSHSIPFLGFFGNWTDPSMFDVGSWPVYATGEETRMPYIGRTRGNDYKVIYADDPDNFYSFGGNPVVVDETYMPERNAINSADMIYGVSFIAIRNAAASKFTAVNETTGEYLLNEQTGPVNSAYFYSGLGTWYNSGATLKTKLSFDSASEGDVISMGFTLAPEYYVDAEGNVDWEALGEGATFGTSMVIDNTAPELHEVYLGMLGNELIVSASDNEYIAAVGLYNKTGTKALSVTGSQQDIEKGETAYYSIPLDQVNGKKFLLQVMDYAMNTTTYLIEMQIGEEVPMPEMIAFDLVSRYWAGFTKNFAYSYKTGMPKYANSDHIFYAATIAEHYIFAATESGDLYVMPEDDLSDTTFIVNLGTILTDMAYNRDDGNVYGVNERNELVVIDKLTGDLTTVGSIGVKTNTLACDAKGNFYCNGLGTGKVYSFTLETMDPPVELTDVGITSEKIQTMEIDPNTGLLYWNSYYLYWGFIGYAYLYEIDPGTGEYTRYNDFWHEMAGLCIPVKTSGDDSWTKPTDKVSAVKLSADAVTLLKGTTTEISANVQPWTAIDRTVTWTSADETIATVNAKGVITGVGAGTTTITAASNLDPNVTAECTVTVELLDITIEGTLQDEDGTPMFYSWNMAADDTWTAGNTLETSMTSATYSTREDAYYIMDSVTNTWSMHKVGKDGVTIGTAANPNGIPLWDMAYNEYFSEVHGEENVSAVYYYYLLSPKNPMNMDAMGFNLSSYVNYLTGIASMGYEAFEDEGEVYDTEHLVLLDNDAYIWNFWIYDVEGGMNAFYNYYKSDLPCEFPGDDTMDNMYTSLVAGEDGALYLSSFNGETNELFRITFDENAEKYVSAKIGEFGDGVWPATITSVTSNTTEEAAAFAAPAATAHMEAVSISRDELAAAALSSRTSTHIMTAADEEAKAELLSSDANVSDDEQIVTVNVTADVLTTNGVTNVTWDAEALELTGMVINADYTAKTEADGSVTFGYVAMNGIEAGESIATLTFKALATDATTVTIEHKQLNNTAGATETVDVEFAHVNTEVRDAVAATCTTAGYTGDTYCTDCGKLIAKGEIIEALGHDYATETVAPTCTDHGYTTYTCTVCGDSYTADFVAPYCASARFTDVALDDWFHEAVDYVAENKLMVGVSATAFDPEGVMNRSQIVTVLYRMASSPEVTEAAPFSDVVAGSFYADAVAWATANGITTGVSADKFNPNGSVTREQMVTFLYRFAKLSGADMTVTGDLSAFKDAASVSTWAFDAFAWAVESGLITGVTPTTLEPAAAASRAQVATVLMRFGA